MILRFLEDIFVFRILVLPNSCFSTHSFQIFLMTFFRNYWGDRGQILGGGMHPTRDLQPCKEYIFVHCKIIFSLYSSLRCYNPMD